MKKVTIFSILIAALVLQGCGRHKVERIDNKEIIDLSGRWNDSDSRLTAEAMVDQILSHHWIPEHHRANNGERPVVVVGLIYNKSHEHINAETFIKDVERAFLNTAKVRLVQAGDKREELRRERAGQQEFASMETAKKWGKEIGADYMLNGDINSIVDTHKKEKIHYYQVNLELSNLETNEVVWIGDHKIRKYIKN